jgi:ABC-2 type transport system permease protein
MFAVVLHYLRIAAQFARVGVIRKSQFRIEFWCQVIMDCLWYGCHVGIFEVLYAHTPDIAGWSREHFRVLLGFLFVSDAFMMIWLSQMWRFGRDLKDGRLDPVRVRPAATLFLYAFQLFSLEGCVNMSVALAYLFYAVAQALGGISIAALGLTVLGIALCCWVRVVLVALMSVIEFWLLGSDVSRFLHDLVYAAADRPMDIFGRRLRSFLLYLLPIGALTQIPASIVLGRIGALQAMIAGAWLFVLGLLVFAAWNRSLRRYESAMG